MVRTEQTGYYTLAVMCICDAIRKGDERVLLRS
jgi:hypothetical protein